MQLYVGTAGYSYRDWVGEFYPTGTRPDGMLPFYARHFPAVEINSSFYRPPTAAQIDRMVQRVPAGFMFSLKVPRSASHDYDDADLPAFKQAAERLQESGQLIGVLVQVAESFANTQTNWDWLTRVVDTLKPLPVAVEFRHRSWDVPTLPSWGEEVGFDVVSVLVPELPKLFPAGLRPGRRVYCRLHSQNAANWYAGGPARYDFDIPDEVLQRWADGLTQCKAERAVVIFNNCVGAQAIGNAKRLTALLRARPGVDVVEPPRADQRSLFDEVE